MGFQPGQSSLLVARASTERIVVFGLAAVLLLVGALCLGWLWLRIGRGPEPRHAPSSSTNTRTAAAAVAVALTRCRRLLKVLATERWVELRLWEMARGMPFNQQDSAEFEVRLHCHLVAHMLASSCSTSRN
jgi:hypothetical protein